MARKIRSIYNLFNNYTKEQINTVVSTLSKEEKELIKLRYGNDLENPNFDYQLTEQEKTNFYKGLVPKIRRRLKNGIKHKRKQFNGPFNIYEHFNIYSKEEVDYVIASLRKYEKRLLILCCGDSYDGNNQNCQITEHEKKYFFNTVIPTIHRKLTRTYESKQYATSKYKKLTIYEYLENYSKEDIDKVLEKLNNEQKQLLNLKFISDDNDLSFDKNITIQQNKKCNNLIIKIKKYLDNPELDISNISNNTNIKTIYKRFSDYSKEEINAVIDLLSDEEKRILEFRYGEDLEKPIYNDKWNEEMSYEFNIHLIPKIKRMLKNPSYASSKGRMPISIYKYFSNYSKKQIDNAILRLNEEEKRLFDLKYGENLKYPLTSINMTDHEKKDFELVKNKIAKLLENPKLTSDSYKLLLPEIYKYFCNYKKIYIDKILEGLTENEKRLLFIRFGKNININIDDSNETKEKVHYLLLKIIYLLDEKTKEILFKPKKKLKNIYECFPEYDKWQVDEVINKLLPEEQHLLYLKYGEDLQGTHTKYVMTKEERAKFRHLIYIKIENELKRIAKKNSSDILSYLVSLIYSHDYSHLLNEYSIKEAMVIVLKFGYINNNFYSITEVAKLLKLELEEVLEISNRYLLNQKRKLEEQSINILTLKK